MHVNAICGYFPNLSWFKWLEISGKKQAAKYCEGDLGGGGGNARMISDPECSGS